jgi:HK97 family phage major capsid protein
MPTLAVPRNQDELAEAIGDSSTLKEIAKTPETLKDYIVAYAEGQTKADPGIADQIRDETQRQFADILRNDKLLGSINRLNLDPNGTPVARSKHYNPKAPGAGLDERWGTWSDYLSATWAGAKGQEALLAQSDIAKIQNAFGSTVPSDGGFLIPEVLRAELLRVALEQAVVRSRARVVPMASLTVPYPMLDSTSNATSVYGGVVGYWTEEAGQLTESAPQFGRSASPRRSGRPRQRSCGRTSSSATPACFPPASPGRCGWRTSTPSPSWPPWRCRSVRAAPRYGWAPRPLTVRARRR